ncbi:MAG TPA: hypothetical protein VEZ40_19245 [Pyrinomonadaceae bacterium]|nr:hypothetical protein [Pyrinomonadaceae bacterium]
MKTKFRRAYVLCVLLAVAGNIVCAQARPEDKLIGKWRQVGGNKIIQEFKPDGTCVSTSAEAPEPVWGKYEFVNERSLKITNVVSGGRKESALLRVQFSGDGKRMKLESDSGFVATFEKLE